MNPSVIKAAVVGSSSVGKTAIVDCLKKHEFNPIHLPTVAGAFCIWQTKVGEQDVRVNVWDTAGQEKFRSLTPSYYRDAGIVFIVYDITSRYSFKDAASWLEEVKQHCQPLPLITVIGNKTDLRGNAISTIPPEEGEAFAASIDAAFFEVTAKHDDGKIELVFQDAVQRSLKDGFVNQVSHARVQSKNIVPVEQTKKARKCCN